MSPPMNTAAEVDSLQMKLYMRHRRGENGDLGRTHSRGRDEDQKQRGSKSKGNQKDGARWGALCNRSRARFPTQRRPFLVAEKQSGWQRDEIGGAISASTTHQG